MIGKTDPRSPTSAPEMWLGEMPQRLSEEPLPDGREAWRARTSQGAEVLARRVRVTEVGGRAQDYLDRLRDLHQGQDSYLTALAGAVQDRDSIWLLFRPVAATSLSRALESEVDPDAGRAVALGIGILHGLATLHRNGLGHSITPESVLVDTMGLPRIDGAWLPVDADDSARQVRGAGRLLCQLLALPEHGGSALLPVEGQAPALVAVVRSLAAGRIEDAASATALLAEGAGGLAAAAPVARSSSQLAERVRSVLSEAGAASRVRREPPPPAATGPVPIAPAPIAPAAPAPRTPAPVAPTPASAPAYDSFPAAPPPGAANPIAPPPIAPAGARQDPAAAPAARLPSSTRTRPKPMVIGPRPSRESTWKAKPPPSRRGRFPAAAVMVAALVVLLVVVAVIGVMRLRGAPQSGVAQPPAGTPTTAPSAAPTPPPGPPQSAGDVKKVEFNFDQPTPCNPGDRACQVHVQVDTNPLPRAATITWSFVITDLCTGKSTTAAGNQVPAGAGWTYVWANNVVQLPPAKRLQIVAQTSEPAVAASGPAVIGQPRC